MAAVPGNIIGPYHWFPLNLTENRVIKVEEVLITLLLLISFNLCIVGLVLLGSLF